MMGLHDGSGFGWFGWLLMSLFLLAFWALLIFGGLAVFRRPRHGNAPQQQGQSAPDDAQRVLDERFARGELDEQEYTHRRDVLRAGR